jgi:hypothetical protein
MAALPQQRIAWEDWEASFGKLRDGSIGELRHESGKSYRIRVLAWERVGDECLFTLDIIDEAAGNA